MGSGRTHCRTLSTIRYPETLENHQISTRYRHGISENQPDMDSIIPSNSQLTPDNIATDPFVKISMPMTFDSQPISQQTIPIVSTPSTQQTNHPQIDLIHPNGITMRITDMTDHQFSELFSSFMWVV